MVNECPLCRASAADGLSCSGCVKNNLYYKQQAIAYKKMSLRDAYEQAKSVLTTNQPVFREQQALAALMRRQGELKTRLQETAERVRDLRLAVARKTFALEERRKAVDVARQRLEEVKRWQGSQSTPVQQGLRWYKEQTMEVVQQRVWTRVLEHFVVFPIEADIPVHVSGKGTQEQAPAFIPPPCPPSRASAGPKPLTGVSTIVGLPLPNAGNYRELGLPDEVCETALYLVARVTWSLAETLGMRLPHPLRFPAGKSYALIAEDAQRRTEFALSPSFYHGGGRSNATSTAPAYRHPPSRRRGAECAGADGTDPFSLGVEALQLNVHQLAVSPAGVGVDARELWGKEAVLLNLWAVQRRAAEVVKAYEGLPDVPLPRVERGRMEGKAEGATGGGRGKREMKACSRVICDVNM
ncbi:hypothetical protein Naga_100047g10 [Nannochloropsis gaditana]|uniref:UV radiation resistance protein/autophagy-related protein 14 n=1 Tax=Nannochloropsis gaditana TaxID=72520 RepID=W7TVG6_9STRA|nr:hypothetical protein Naga_100047g10 [Nannochloropsis gaditana]